VLFWTWWAKKPRRTSSRENDVHGFHAAARRGELWANAA
jgi:hypothetical protein